MKKIPYKHCFVVVQINNNIEKIFFEEVVDYKDYSNPDFDEHRAYMFQMAVANNYCADKLFMQLSQSYLNEQLVISEFNKIAEKNKICKQNSCVTLIVHIDVNDDGSGSIQIDTKAFDDKRYAFDFIANHASHSTMLNFVDGLEDRMQDILFDI